MADEKRRERNRAGLVVVPQFGAAGGQDMSFAGDRRAGAQKADVCVDYQGANGVGDGGVGGALLSLDHVPCGGVG